MNSGRTVQVIGGCLLILVPRWAGAQEALPSFQGYTGLWNTPNALVLPEGAGDVVFQDQVDPRWRRGNDWSTNYILTAGLLSHVEVGLRVSAFAARPRNFHDDLSANLKVQLPFLPDWMPKVALGMQDVGGGTAFYRTKYAVASQDLGPLRLSLGGGTGPSRMKGLFWGGEWRVNGWLQVAADRDTQDTSLGLKVGTPEGILPAGLVLGGFAKSTLNDRARHLDAGVFLRVPLGGGRASWGSAPPPPSRSEPPPKVASGPPEPRAQGALAPLPERALPAGMEAELRALGARLARLGFENLRVGTRGRTLVLEYENHRFNHNELDGLGLVLGTALAAAPEGLDTFLVVLKKRNLRLLDVEGPLAPVRAFFAGPARQDPGLLRALIRVQASEAFAGPAGVQWAGPEISPGGLHTSLILAPSLDSRVATEFGVFDYRLALAPETLTALWSGAVLNVAWDVPLARSDNFRAGRPFASADGSASLTRALLSQALPLAPGLMTQFSGGIFDGVIHGALNETRWSPGTGIHQFGAQAGRFTGSGSVPRNLLLGSYRVFLPVLDTSLEVAGGRFYNRDTGFLVTLRRQFRDTGVEVFYSRTTDQMVGLRLSLPLTPRKDMRPGFLQVRGPERWSYGLSTTVHDPSGRNQLAYGRASMVRTTTALDRSLYNADRLSEAYVLEHLDRLREAYALWKDL